MPFPRKFQPLLELELPDVDRPDYAWLVYSVCACTPDACGWGGWVLDGAFQKLSPEIRATRRQDKVLPGIYHPGCPRCGKPLFRTGADLRLEPSLDQTPALIPGVDYQVVPMEYED
jgi:hypothetical protein